MTIPIGGDGGDASSPADAALEMDAPAEAGDAQPDTSVDASADAAMDSEAGKPTTTCVDPALVNGSYNHLCSANSISVSPGGLFAVGDYVNSQVQGLPYCPIAYVIGWAQAYVENGVPFFRYVLYRKTSAGDQNPTILKGTWWIKANGSGPIEVEEMCDLQNKGKTKAGTLSVVGNKFTLTWPNGQETWDKQ